MSVTLEVFQPERSPTEVRAEQLENIMGALVRLEVFQLDRSPTEVRAEQRSNMDCMVVTLEMFQPERSRVVRLEQLENI